MFNILRGFIAGLVATLLISILMGLAHLIGVMPELSILPQLDGEIKNPVGLPLLPALGWAIHFLIGTLIWSFIFALLAGKGSVYSPKTHAILFSLALWLIQMLVLMPIAGNGLFGLGNGILVPVLTLALHILWGWAIGILYDLLPSAS